MSTLVIIPSFVQTNRATRRLAWSRVGSLAQITQNGLGVSLQHLVCKPEDGKWDLSEESPIEAIPHLHKGQKLTHLSWSPTGSELAVVDANGRISVLIMSLAMNNILVLRSPSKDLEDDLNAPVGMYWLNLDRNVKISERTIYIGLKFS